MRILAAAISVVAMSVAVLPAAAQYGQVERTQAEIALEEATANLETNRGTRTEASQAWMPIPLGRASFMIKRVIMAT